VIAANNLVKKYNGKAAVKGVNFSVEQRECFGILGPNGAGKSSIANMIFCFFPVTQGDLFVLGMNVREKQRSIKERLGVVPQENIKLFKKTNQL
ncbi:MAG: ATP-binding cassette domain-containing protein, partial [Candidatus ainarchaeum sp.]|nr:ATP-binding cassette domain-containing protein [Candidatus ainarchaeum sp.]